MSPTQRSKKHLEELGYRVAIVEHFNSFAKCRVDLFGIIDLLAIHVSHPGCLGIQTTTRDNFSARKNKALGNDVLPIWLAAGNRFHLHGWGLLGATGKRKTYEVRIEALVREDFR